MFDGFTTLSFDCYGTLIDWEAGIVGSLQPWVQRSGLDLDGAALLAAHARHEARVQQENKSLPYPRVLAQTLRRIGDEHGVPVSDGDAEEYGSSVGEWPAFPDTVEALQRLRRRFKLVILSNIDRGSFAMSNRRLGVEFDLIVTAEDVGSYKPDLANFEFMFRELADMGIPREQLLHVAESLYHDHEPAQRLGLPAVWIHRRHDQPGSGATASPTRTIRPPWRYTSLVEFADAALSSPTSGGSTSRG